MSIDQIASKALQLNPKDRAVLASAIWESLEEPFLSESDMSEKEAMSLVKKREEEITSGKVIALTHNELMKKLSSNGG